MIHTPSWFYASKHVSAWRIWFGPSPSYHAGLWLRLRKPNDTILELCPSLARRNKVGYFLTQYKEQRSLLQDQRQCLSLGYLLRSQRSFWYLCNHKWSLSCASLESRSVARASLTMLEETWESPSLLPSHPPPAALPSSQAGAAWSCKSKTFSILHQLSCFEHQNWIGPKTPITPFLLTSLRHSLSQRWTHVPSPDPLRSLHFALR